MTEIGWPALLDCTPYPKPRYKTTKLYNLYEEELRMLTPETYAKLTTTLSGDIDLYETVIKEIKEQDDQLAEKTETLTKLNTDYKVLEERNNNHLNQISNLVSKIPMGTVQKPQSFEDKLQAAKTESWKK